MAIDTTFLMVFIKSCINKMQTATATHHNMLPDSNT